MTPEPDPEADRPDEADEGTIEARLPGFRYGIVLLLLLATFIVEASAYDGAWYRVVTVALDGLTLVAAFLASGVNRHLMRIASVVAILAVAGAVVAAANDTASTGAVFAILSFLLVIAAPVVIARAIIRRGVDIHTVLGALCIYVMLGMLWAFLYGSIGAAISEPFFAQTRTASSADYLYFSFVTLTTTGYGDFTAATGLGRAVAVLEALSGQLYLVTIVALLVARMATSAMPRLRQQEDVASESEDRS
jgi:hypothetical protein